MSDCADNGVAWRRVITPILKQMGVVVLDPTAKPIEIGVEDSKARGVLAAMKADGKIAEAREAMKVIRRVDLRCIDLSSFVIVRLDGTPTVGTYEEIAMSVSQSKPTLIWLDGKLNKNNVSDWILAQVPLEYLFESMDDLVAYLRRIDSSEKHPEDRRWMLFDLARLYREVLI